MVNKPKEFAHLLRDKFGSADQINMLGTGKYNAVRNKFVLCALLYSIFIILQVGVHLPVSGVMYYCVIPHGRWHSVALQWVSYEELYMHFQHLTMVLLIIQYDHLSEKAQIPLHQLLLKLPNRKSLGHKSWKLWTQSISTCRNVVTKCVTNPFVSL